MKHRFNYAYSKQVVINRLCRLSNKICEYKLYNVSVLVLIYHLEETDLFKYPSLVLYVISMFREDSKLFLQNALYQIIVTICAKKDFDGTSDFIVFVNFYK